VSNFPITRFIKLGWAQAGMHHEEKQVVLDYSTFYELSERRLPVFSSERHLLRGARVSTDFAVRQWRPVCTFFIFYPPVYYSLPLR